MKRNYVAIAFDGKVQFMGTLKDGKNYYRYQMYWAQGFSRECFTYNATATAEHAITTKFFNTKAAMNEWVETYTLNDSLIELQDVTNVVAIAEAIAQVY